MAQNIRIAMLSTGDEVLYGQIIDTNAAWLSDLLFQEGFSITSRHTTGDNLGQLVEVLQTYTQYNDVLIVNGGLGPTKDDLSAQAAAEANNEILVLHPEWVAVMEAYFSSRHRVMSPSNLKQAMLPRSATVINNPVGTACGFRMVINHCTVFFTPGVPNEFKTMMTDEIVPYLHQIYPDNIKPLCYRLTTMGRSESDIATQLEQHLLLPEDISLGYRSAMPIIELKLTGPVYKQAEMDKWWQVLKADLQDNTLYEGTVGLPRLVALLLQHQSLKLSIIEQYTSGLCAYQLHCVNAPIMQSMTYEADKTIDIIELGSKLQSDQLLLGLVDFDHDNSQFTLFVASHHTADCFRLNYTGRKPPLNIEHEVFMTIALDALRRYLIGKPLVGANIWLDVIKEERLTY